MPVKCLSKVPTAPIISTSMLEEEEEAVEWVHERQLHTTAWLAPLLLALVVKDVVVMVSLGLRKHRVTETMSALRKLMMRIEAGILVGGTVSVLVFSTGYQDSREYMSTSYVRGSSKK